MNRNQVNKEMNSLQRLTLLWKLEGNELFAKTYSVVETGVLFFWYILILQGLSCSQYGVLLYIFSLTSR